MTVAASPTVQSAFYDQIVAQAKSTLGAALGNIDPVPVEITGQGQFPYNYRDVSNNQSVRTWSYLNAVMVPGQVGGVAFGGPFTDAYSTLLGQLSWSLSSADKAQMDQASLAAQQQISALVSQYESLFGTITQAQIDDAGVSTKLDYIIAYRLNQWAGANAPLQISNDNIDDLSDLLPNLSPSALSLLPTIAQYLQSVESVFGLINAGGNASHLLTALKNSLKQPTTDNGAVMCSDGRLRPAWNVDQSMQDLENGIANAGSSFTIKFSASQYDENSTSLSVNGEAAGSIPVADFLSVNVGASVNYDMYAMNESGSTFDVTMTFPGVTLVTFKPARYEVTTKTGWYFATPISDAVQNHGEDVSGWQLTPWPQNIDFSQGGDFGLLEALIVSDYPTVTINFTSGEASENTWSLAEHANVGVSLFGFQVGGVDQSYDHTQVNKHSQGGGFDITLKPAPRSADLLSQTAYVIAGAVTYPGVNP